jgi:hypothetical protein
MDKLINTIKSLSQEQLVEFVKTHPYHAVKIQHALRAMKKEMAIRDEIRGRISKHVDADLYM